MLEISNGNAGTARSQARELETCGFVEAVVPTENLDHVLACLRPVELPCHPYGVVTSTGCERIEIAIVICGNLVPLTDEA
ncbi:MAG: hypothetical protein ACYSUY_07340 [Planctomycetota bacterium]|jgi:hypothetical protein